MRVFTAIPMADWRQAGLAARAAEDVGFDAVMTVELGHDVFTPLALAALATQRVELTPSIAVAFPRSPTITASNAWDLHANSNGRFVLGLGSQVKGHNERRFGIDWTPPAPRLRDYIGALRALWHCWETRAKLDYHSPHYTLTLMTPAFSPEPTGLPMVPVTVAAVASASARVRERIAFYGSTRTYLPILALHGQEELGLKLHTMSVRGRWQEMAAEISDQVLHIFAACAPYDGLAAAVADRFGGAADSIDLNFPADAPVGLQREVLADIRRIPHRFTGFDRNRVVL